MGVWDQPYQYWLMKAEPDVYPVEQWQKDGVTFWDGVRNYTARNFLRERMKKGQGMLFYYSGAKPSGIIGVGEIVKEGYPDPSAFDPKDPHYDEKSDPKNPTWYCVDVRHKKTLKSILPIDFLKKQPELKNMALFKYSRLSVQPVTDREWAFIQKLIAAQK
ncbi:MAG TPA: EVE domain-containing protein [bacterium]|nr:EVE domain-containing protein [bacterium]